MVSNKSLRKLPLSQSRQIVEVLYLRPSLLPLSGERREQAGDK